MILSHKKYFLLSSHHQSAYQNMIWFTCLFFQVKRSVIFCQNGGAVSGGSVMSSWRAQVFTKRSIKSPVVRGSRGWRCRNRRRLAGGR